MPAPDRKRRLTAFAVAMAVLIATPLAVVAADAFNDVPDSNVHHEDITWLRDNGVTFGCNPPANTEFCPGDPVLRQQMASFMRRLAENRVVDAATALEADHATTADNATTADSATNADNANNADTLDGANSTAYQTVIRGSACDDECQAGETVTEQVNFEITAPAVGVMHLDQNVAALAEASELRSAAWLTVNEACGSNGAFVFAPTNAVAGSWTYEDAPNVGGFSNASLATSTAIEVPAGTHTVRLCTVVIGGGAGDVASASATAMWSAEGSALSLAGGGIPYQQFDQATLDMLESDSN